MPKPAKQDPLGDFLTQYDEYLDGQRSYSDLPAFPGGDSSERYDSRSQSVPNERIRAEPRKQG